MLPTWLLNEILIQQARILTSTLYLLIIVASTNSHVKTNLSLNDIFMKEKFSDTIPDMKTRDFAKKAIREQIALTALRHFQKNGFENTTIEDIANDIGMSTRTYFRYFRSKDDVLLAPIQAFTVRFLDIFSQHFHTQDIWASLEIALGEAALNCDELDPMQLGPQMQIVIRSTPALFARQLEIVERLQVEATDLYLSKATDADKLNWSTANAIIRCGFACLHAIECSHSTHLKDDQARTELRKLMVDLKPAILPTQT